MEVGIFWKTFLDPAAPVQSVLYGVVESELAEGEVTLGRCCFWGSGGLVTRAFQGSLTYLSSTLLVIR
jgi:hypothetical protein